MGPHEGWISFVSYPDIGGNSATKQRGKEAKREREEQEREREGEKEHLLSAVQTKIVK